VKNLFEIIESIPSVRGWTAIENGPNIHRLGKSPTIEQLMNGDNSGLPSWLPSAPLGPLLRNTPVRRLVSRLAK